uniref:Uncharacterized protein n=1 Tax=Ursus americanus TaxID=9643 RepID=A0A452SKQ0_URSAM
MCLLQRDVCTCLLPIQMVPLPCSVPSTSMTGLARSRTHSASSCMGCGESAFSRSVTNGQSDRTPECSESPAVVDRPQPVEMCS